jgi:hypothetical protein
MNPRRLWKRLSMVPGLILAMVRVASRDPLLATRLGRVMRMSGSDCMGQCSAHCTHLCLGHSLSRVQGYRPTPQQRRLLAIAASPVRKALREP